MNEVKKEYSILIKNIGEILEKKRRQAAYAVNSIILETYWDVGRQIVEYEQEGNLRSRYGSKLLKKIASDLNQKGFSVDNLEKMRRFYLEFKKSETVSRKLTWSHYCTLIRIKGPIAKRFYLIECHNEMWSVRELQRQINSMLFERIALSRDKKGVLELSKKGQIVEKSSDLIKDPYVLEFLNLKDKYSETDLEQKIIDNLKDFLLEMGKGFMFVKRQKRITLDNEHFYIDLVFYNRLLKCFVIIELKIGKLTHKDLGQLQMYVNYYDMELKSKEENPTIGILLCADKKETIVKYTLPKKGNIFASEYKLYLPDKKELETELRRLLK